MDSKNSSRWYQDPAHPPQRADSPPPTPSMDAVMAQIVVFYGEILELQYQLSCTKRVLFSREGVYSEDLLSTCQKNIDSIEGLIRTKVEPMLQEWKTLQTENMRPKKKEEKKRIRDRS